MANSDFSRAEVKDIEILKDRLFDASLDFSRSDSGSVDFTGKVIKMEVWDKRGMAIIVTLTSGTEITISTSALTFNKIFTELEEQEYQFQIYNDTDKIGIRRGKLRVV